MSVRNRIVSENFVVVVAGRGLWNVRNQATKLRTIKTPQMKISKKNLKDEDKSMKKPKVIETLFLVLSKKKN